jgi:hypothetical protein
MEPRSFAHWLVSQEARALLTRIDRVKPFALQETMVLAAALTDDAETAIERHLEHGKLELTHQTRTFLGWLEAPEGKQSTPEEAQRRFTFLKLRFNAVLSQFDIFAEALSQRSEAETGVWLAGLDIVARDALALPGYFAAPPVVCYLARGPGAAIRRARTRLPGGDENPVAVVRLPRERMIGAGLASSLVHEVGHQGAALLNLVESLRAALAAMPAPGGLAGTAWGLWNRWMSEIVADMWAVAKVGIASTAGLISVVSLPRAFVFRINSDDPHPSPWIRVKLSAAIGKALYPHPQWDRLMKAWDAYYPKAGLDDERRDLFAALEQTMPAFVDFLVAHRPATLSHQPLADVMVTRERQPEMLSALLSSWQAHPDKMRSAPPSLVFAVIGQARSDGAITPEKEGTLLADLLKHWALHGSLDTRAICADRTQPKPPRAITAKASYPAQAVY